MFRRRSRPRPQRPTSNQIRRETPALSKAWRVRQGMICAAILTLGLIPLWRATGQAPTPSAPAETAKSDKSGAIPRLPDWHPDLQGLWHNDSGYQAMMKNMRSGKGLAVALGDFHGEGFPLPLPYLPEAEKVRDYRKLHDPYHDPEAHCHVPGVPRETEQPSSLMPFQIIQDEKYVVFLYEYVHDVRIVPEDGSAHPKKYWAWDGDSRGHWEGDTFVVDVSNFNGRSWLDMEGNFVDENEHVVERYTMSGPNAIDYAALVEDPTVFTKPWTIHLTLTRNPAKDQIVYYDCHEGERDVQHYTQSEGNKANKHE